MSGRSLRERENPKADSMLNAEPNVGLDPMIHEIISWAETKLIQLSHPGTCPVFLFKPWLTLIT